MNGGSRGLCFNVFFYCVSLHVDVNILLNATGFEVQTDKEVGVVFGDVVGNGLPLFIVLSVQVYTVRNPIAFPSLLNSAWSLHSAEYSTLRFRCV